MPLDVAMKGVSSLLLPSVTDDNLKIVIPFRDPKSTKAALNYACGLIEGLKARIRLIHVVPYGIPLDQPTVRPKRLEGWLKKVARQNELPVASEIVHARDWEQGFRRRLAPQSVVLLPMRRTCWCTSEKRLGARLRRLGHTVVWVDSDEFG